MSIGSSQSETRVVLSGISWSTFESVLAETQNHGTRFTYDRGYLEMMSPSREHERAKRFIGRMIEAATEELGIPISSASSTTLKAEWDERGLEADESYYIANEARVRGRDEIDLRVDPPPDLAIEVDISSSSLDQLGIYADLGRARGVALRWNIAEGSSTPARRNLRPADAQPGVSLPAVGGSRAVSCSSRRDR